jgi:hypothetical protein
VLCTGPTSQQSPVNHAIGEEDTDIVLFEAVPLMQRPFGMHLGLLQAPLLELGTHCSRSIAIMFLVNMQVAYLKLM